jgi:alkanesulfonate monooxygenase SsuD/methylene tetrahydromethanopterin reductase-like flavin-dependent oxidoreductase (luciferase family)
MRYGFVLPGGTATEQLELGVLAELSGWDGIFSFEISYGVDPWTLLAAVAASTQRIRLGTLLTPLPWRRPWKLASQLVTLDQLSNGRAILAVGLGAVDAALGTTGETTDRRLRAELLDEGIDLIRGLWQGHLQFSGKHYQVNLEARTDDLARTGRPLGERIPIWVVGVWPRGRSMRRVLRCDGLIPAVMGDAGLQDTTTPEHIRAMRAWLTERGASANFDIISEGETPADDRTAAQAHVAPWAEAGCTWWLETRWMLSGEPSEQLAQIRARIQAGPPRA